MKKELTFNHYIERTKPKGKEIRKTLGNREHLVRKQMTASPRYIAMN